MKTKNNISNIFSIKILSYLLLLFTSSLFSQIKGKVLNNQTQKGIPYVNIWIENENIGTTSNEQGEFILKPNQTSKNIIFSAIGYETKKISLKDFNKQVTLKPVVTELNEVTIISKKETKELSIDKFKKHKINSSYACSGIPWMVAKFFPYKKKYEDTPFLQSLTFLTRSKIKNSKFNIRLLSIGSDGKPYKYLYDKNIYGVAKKGKKYTKIDVSKLNIPFPKEGFFVAVEWLIIDSNKYEYSYTWENSKVKQYGVRYEPSISSLPVNNNENCWIYSKGFWKKNWKNSKKALKIYRGKYNQLAIELILSN